MTKLSIGKAIKHDSAELHVSGEAAYIDDLPEVKGMLYAAVGLSEKAHAKIIRSDLSKVQSAEGVVAVISSDHIPGLNDVGGPGFDEPIFAYHKVEFIGQSVFAVAATSVELARRAVKLAEIEYDVLEHNLDIASAVENQTFILPSKTMSRGDAQSALNQAPNRLSGQFHLGGQEQFYLEGQIAVAVPNEHGDMKVYSSTQHPHHVQESVAAALAKTQKDVTIECRRAGGGFGGKENQSSLFACVAALLASKTGRAVKYRADRDDDMMMTGKRHCFDIGYDVGFDDAGLIQGIKLSYASRCGFSIDLSGPINDRAMFHADNTYFLEDVLIDSHRCKTNSQSNTAFRGFGGPQGMMAIETVVDDIARYLALDPLQIRRVNFYGVDGTRNVTHYQMEVEDNVINEIVDELEASSNYQQRRTAIEKFNQDSLYLKKGIALTPVKFGISFTATFFNQAGALLLLYSDGTFQLNHGGIEMGQGLFTKVAQVVAEEFQVSLDTIRCTATDTAKVPNASATAASSGSDINGMAAKNAAEQIKQRLIDFLVSKHDVTAQQIRFAQGSVFIGQEQKSFAEVAHAAWFNRIQLSATGFYKTPKIHYDQKTMTGRPFYYFAYGAAVSEVTIDTLTGEYKIDQVDILHDVGSSLNTAIDIGQIEGGFIQGVGWLTTEQLWWNEQGRLMTHAPSTYKIPVAGDVPEKFTVKLASNLKNKEETIYRSKAVGEPPFMLGMSVFFAIKDAVSSVANHQNSVLLNAPATPEEVLMAVSRVEDNA